MVGVVGGLTKREHRSARMAVDGFRNVDVPVCGQWDRVRIASLIGTIPRDGHVAIGLGGDPGEHIRLSSLRRVLSYLDGRRPTGSLRHRERVVDVSVVRPDSVQVAELVDRECGEQIAEPGARGTRRTRPATEDFVVSERECGTRETHARGHAHVGSVYEAATVIRVVGGIVRAHKDLVEVPVTCATAPVHLDLAGDVAGGRTDAWF